MRISSMLLVCISCFFLSCTPLVEQGVSGLWVIETALYEGDDIVRCMTVNAIAFKQNTCEFPLLFEKPGCPAQVNLAQKGTWVWKQNAEGKVVVKVTIENVMFHKDFALKFLEDKGRKLLIMKLESEDLILFCIKALYDYNENQSLTKKLVKKTSG